MMKSDDFYRTFERDFASWAGATDDIRAAFIVGSRSRDDHPADEWSDLDIILYADNRFLFAQYRLAEKPGQNMGNLYL